MALSEKHRHSIYAHLAPQWGDEVTQAFLSQFPAREGEEPITRDYLRAELTGLRGELKVEMAGLRVELKEEMAGLRGELKQEMGDLRAELKQDVGDLRAELKEEIAAVDGRLGRFGSRLAGLVVGVTALILTGLGIATTVTVTQLN
jgi:hypothetical protein